MRKLWLIPGILAALVVLPLAYALAAYVVLSIFGYHPDAIGQELAKELVGKGGNPRECLQIIHPLPHPFSPTADEQRGNCIYEYAKLTQDPSACELLMPSDYGWDCLGIVASLINTGVGCSSYASGEIYCSSGVRGRNIGVDDCRKYKEADLKYWCYGERTRTLEGVYDCDKIPADPPILRDECQRWYAYKLKDTSLCSSIRDDKLRKVCELKIQYAR
ncbi:MAG: hypothetical protein WC840_03110 [Candidatus Peribacteraceae bacterium]